MQGKVTLFCKAVLWKKKFEYFEREFYKQIHEKYKQIIAAPLRIVEVHQVSK